MRRMAQQHYTVADVFVPGKQPTVTYNPRKAYRLEERVREYLEERGKILALSGPTKCGKTVLLTEILKDRPVVWLSGGDIGSRDALWDMVVDKLDGQTDIGGSVSEDQREATTTSGGASIKPFGVGPEANASRSKSTGIVRMFSFGRRRPSTLVASEALIASGAVLVIDDFHYVKKDVQLDVIRSMKSLVFRGLPVIFAAVPHRAFDVVRAEKEMTGRVEQLNVPFWTADELRGIAREGFAALNVRDGGGVVDRVIGEAFHSPHLMQEFCLQICKENEVKETGETSRVVLASKDWDTFFRARCSMAAKDAFEHLAHGPKRSDRIPRLLKDGRKVDIYTVVLEGIAHTGPLESISYEQLRGSLREIMAEDQPQRHEITRVLEIMAKIAREDVGGEPVVDFDKEPNSILTISDPYFAYYLKWCRPIAAEVA